MKNIITYIAIVCLASLSTAQNSEFITTWQATTDNESITIPTFTDETYNYTVNWGDGITTSNHTGDASHTYASAGTYDVSISGLFPRIYLVGTTQENQDKIIDVKQWGNNAWTSMSFAFSNCSNLEFSATDAPDLSSVTDVSGMFLGASSFNQPIGHWDVSNVQNMSFMFLNAATFNQPLNNWDVSSVQNMSSMFDKARAFNQPLNNWDVSNVTNMFVMFRYTDAFDQALDTWDVSSVTDMNAMLYFSNLSTDNYDATLQAWAALPSLQNNVVLGANNLNYCTVEVARNVLVNTYGWIVRDAGLDCTNSTQTFITTWQTTTDNESITIPTFTDETYNYTVDWGDGTTTSNHIGDASHTYASAGTYDVSIIGLFPQIYLAGTNQENQNKIIDVKQWGTNTWTSMSFAFLNCSNLEISATDAPDLSSVTDVSGMFLGASSFNQSIDHWDVSNVQNMSFMFRLSASFNQPLNNWDVSSVQNMSFMFDEARAFNQPLNNWDVSNVTNMSVMFRYTDAFDQALDTWDVSSVTDMNGMLSFSNLSTDNYDATLQAWAVLPNLQNNVVFGALDVNYCTGVLARQYLIDTYSWSIIDAGLDCTNSTQSFITTWQTTTNNESITIPTFSEETYNYTVDWGDGTTTSNHTEDASHTYAIAGTYDVSIIGLFPRIYFFGATQANRDKIIDVKQWDTNPWTSMSVAFAGCQNLEVSATDAPNLTNVSSLFAMFASASSFNQSINHWDVSNITSMNNMFVGTTSFNQPLDNWDTSNVTTMAFSFQFATAFNQPLDTWDVSNVQSMDNMLTGSNLSIENYDTTLESWAALPSLQNNVTLGADNLNYCNGETARNTLINNFDWTITDGGLDCSILNTNEESLQNLKLYPNPTTDYISIFNLNAEENYIIYDALGKKVNSGQLLPDSKISVSQLQKGIYFLKLNNYKTLRFIKN